MRAALIIARNELQRVLVDRVALLLMLLLPVVIMATIGSTYFGLEEGLPIGVIDNDHSELSEQVQSRLGESPVLKTLAYHDADALARDVRTGRIDAGVVLPAGLERSALDGTGGRLSLVIDPLRRSTGAIYTVVSGALAEEGSPLSAALMTSELTDGEYSAHLGIANELAISQAHTEVAVQALGGSAAGSVNEFSYTAPANLVLFVFISSLAIAASMVEAVQLGAIDRIRSGPVRTSSITVGFGMSRVLFTIVQSVLLLGVGATLFGVDFGDPLGVALLVVAFSLACAGAGLLVGALVRNAQQAQAVGIPVAVAMGMLGGAMWPLEFVGATMRTVGHAVPQAWAVDAWVELIFDGGSARDVFGEVAVLLAFAVAFLTLGSGLLHRRLTAS